MAAEPSRDDIHRLLRDGQPGAHDILHQHDDDEPHRSAAVPDHQHAQGAGPV